MKVGSLVIQVSKSLSLEAQPFLFLRVPHADEQDETVQPAASTAGEQGVLDRASWTGPPMGRPGTEGLDLSTFSGGLNSAAGGMRNPPARSAWLSLRGRFCGFPA